MALELAKPTSQFAHQNTYVKILIKAIVMKLYIAKNKKLVAMLIKTRLNNVMLPKLFTVVNNTVQIVIDKQETM